MSSPLTCTIIAANYLPQARVLARSIAQQHPAERLQVLLFDDVREEFSGDGEPFELLRPADLHLSRQSFNEMVASYEVLELATALKPSLLQTLLQRTNLRPVLYLDPDVMVFSPLDELAALAAQHSIVLTPHLARPMPRDAKKPSELDILASGVWNLGCICVGAGAEPFLKWWDERLRRDAVVEHAEMLFTDQRWVDLALGCFDVFPLRKPGYNVAYWNADHRTVEWTGAEYRVDGTDLVFFHFSGFDPRRPHILSKHQGDRPRVVLSESPALRRLCETYVARLEAAGLAEWRSAPYGYGTMPDGTPFTPPMRAAVRRGLIGSDLDDGIEPPPDPLDPESVQSFFAWLAAPEPRNAQAPTIPRVFLEVHQQRQDVREAFRDLSLAGADRFLSWVRTYGVNEERVPDAVVKLVLQAQPAPALEAPDWNPHRPLRPGFLLAGYLETELGLGEAARRMVSVMDAAGFERGIYPFRLSRSPRRLPSPGSQSVRTDLNTNLVWINPDQLGQFADEVGRGFFEGRHTVGYWAWETESPPPAKAAVNQLVDEIWAPSEFSRRAIQTAMAKPVLTFPHTVFQPQPDEGRDPRELGVPDGFVFLFLFDFFSTLSRKNPLGLIEAFCRAFRPSEGPTLVLKSINGWHVPNERERIACRIAERDDIVLVDQCFTAAECATMLARADCYVSLHRAEGFGLTIADAMALGTPVIATGYSGNLDYMSEENSYLVPATPTRVGPEAGPYPAEDVWGEPDLDIAAELMRRVYEAPDEARRKGCRARRDILTTHGYAASARFLAKQFTRIQELMLST